MSIISQLAPPQPTAIMSLNDIRTQTLLALMRACRLTNQVAADLFRRHCILVEGSRRLKALARCMLSAYSRDRPVSLPSSPLCGIINMYMCPFDEYEAHENDEYSPISDSPIIQCSVDPDDMLPPSMSLPAAVANDGGDQVDSQQQDRGQADQQEDGAAGDGDADADADSDADSDSDYDYDYPPDFHSPLEDLSTAMRLLYVFQKVAPSLTALIANIPLRTLWPEQDVWRVRPLLRRAFQALVNLEEFVSVRDELFLRTKPRRSLIREPSVWATCWPRLRRLSLYNVDCGGPECRFWPKLNRLPFLEMVVLPRVDPCIEMGNINVKQEILRSRAASSAGTPSSSAMPMPSEDTGDRPPLTLDFVNVSGEVPNFTQWRDKWSAIDPHDNINIRVIEVPDIGSGSGSRSDNDDEHEDENDEDEDDEDSDDFNPIQVTQDWTLRLALAGTLFDKEDKTRPWKQSESH
jgi:hypothetical protein